MPTKQLRYKCTICGSKRVISKLISWRNSRKDNNRTFTDYQCKVSCVPGTKDTLNIEVFNLEILSPKAD